MNLKLLFGKGCILFLVFIFNHQYCNAQVDSSYIGSYKQRFSARVFVADNFTSVKVKHGSYEETYKPNIPLYGGVGLEWDGLRFDLYVGIGDAKNKNCDKSKSLSMISHYYRKNFTLDFIGQSYKGLYLDGEDKDILRPDIKLKKFGGLFQYVFNGNHFSYRAAFDQTEKQLKSSGSLLAGAGFYYTQLKGDSAFMSNAFIPKHHCIFGPSIGYIYTWVIKRDFFISAALSGAINIGLENIDKGVDVYPAFFPRFSAGYNGDKWAVNLSGIYDQTFVSYSKNKELSFNSQSIQLTFLKRF